jgi:membrane protease subunit HflC
VQEIKGEADAKASEVYARIYASSPAAADFYVFVQTLDTYKTTLGADSTVIFTTDSDYFRLLKRIDPPAASAP